MTKQPRELALLAESGRLLASVFGLLDRTALAGMSTLQVNEMVERFIVHDLRARPASKGQYGYGFVLNSSVNDVVCHGVPSQSEVLRSGDIVNFDITLEKNGYIADSSKTYLVGEVSPAAKRNARPATCAVWSLRLIRCISIRLSASFQTARCAKASRSKSPPSSRLIRASRFLL